MSNSFEVVTVHLFVESESKGSENERARAASCDNKGHARDDDDRSDCHFGTVRPQPIKRPVNV